jgi:hypothetical protein
MEGIPMIPANLMMSLTSTVTIGHAGLLMYESGDSISKTSPMLLAIMVRALTEQNWA